MPARRARARGVPAPAARPNPFGPASPRQRASRGCSHANWPSRAEGARVPRGGRRPPFEQGCRVERGLRTRPRGDEPDARRPCSYTASPNRTPRDLEGNPRLADEEVEPSFPPPPHTSASQRNESRAVASRGPEPARAPPRGARTRTRGARSLAPRPPRPDPAARGPERPARPLRDDGTDARASPLPRRRPHAPRQPRESVRAQPRTQ